MNYGKDTPTQEGRAETLVRHSIWFSPEAWDPQSWPGVVEALVRCLVRGQVTRTVRLMVDPAAALLLKIW